MTSSSVRAFFRIETYGLLDVIDAAELRRQLHSLFSTYGRVLDVVATRAPSMRGQAFVVFESATASTAAKRGLSGFSFYGKALHIDYSTGDKSKALLRRELGDDAVHELELERSRTTVSRRGEKRALFLDAPSDDEDNARPESESEGDEAAARKRVKREDAPEGTSLHATGIPPSIDAEVLTTLFSRQQGYLGLTASPDPPTDEPWTAIIRFDSTQNTQAAQSALHGIQLDPTYTLDLSVL